MESFHILVRSCHDILKEGNTRTGIYKTTIGQQEKEVFCDMQSSGGGWTVLQRRGDFGNPPDHFFRNWTAYRDGFGEAAKEIWLGLEAIYLLTNNWLMITHCKAVVTQRSANQSSLSPSELHVFFDSTHSVLQTFY